MKKLLSLLSIAGMFTFTACGPSAEEKAAKEKATKDSIAADEAMKAEAKAKAETDSIAKYADEMKAKMEADSIEAYKAKKAEKKTAKKPAAKVETPKPEAPKTPHVNIKAKTTKRAINGAAPAAAPKEGSTKGK